MAAPAIFRALSAAIRSASTTIGPRDVFTRRAVGFMIASSGGADQTARPIAEDDMDGDHIRAPEQFLLGDQLGVRCRCALGRQILTPGNHIHAECLADLRDGPADIAKTDNAQRSPGHVVPDEPLPTAAAQRGVLGSEIAGTGQDKCPGQFDCRRRGVARMNDLDAPLFCSLEIDRGIPKRRRGDQAELGQALDDSACHRRALPHHADDIECLQALDDGVGVREMIVKYGDRAPIFRRICDRWPNTPRACASFSNRN